MDRLQYIRNFAIVAHIDHGKSTLADRLLEVTGTIEMRLMTDQILDSNPIERERGITIKLAPVRMKYKFHNEEYILNLIDTPGHVDFSYEVSRSLDACEGIILVVDATQGIQAQTIAHMQLIDKRKLKVIPVINKIDLPTAKIKEVRKSIIDTFGFDENEIIEISAKTGINIDKVLEGVILKVPPPSGLPDKPLRALVFSSLYDSHKGVIVFVRIVDGSIQMKDFSPNQSNISGKKLKFHASKTSFLPLDIGIFAPERKNIENLNCGEVGYIATGLKDLKLARIGDTLQEDNITISPLPGYMEPKPMVYLSLFPTDNDQFQELRESIEKLHLSDCSFSFKPHSSLALGKGFLCGFLGLLHAEIVKERLTKEFNLNIIATAPTVEYKILYTNGNTKFIHTPDDFPDPSITAEIKEPVMYASIYTPSTYVGTIMQLCEGRRGEFVNLEYLGDQAKFTYIIPLSEMIIDFFDKMKSQTSGYASLDYEFYEHRKSDVVKVDILINKEKVDAFSQLIVKDRVNSVASYLVEKLKDLIPRHQFQIPIQAVIGGKIIARSDVKSFRKDVTQKLYGGDQSRKDKLLDAQKKGKKKMRSVGNVELPQEIFLDLYKNS